MNCNLDCSNCLRELCMHKVPLFATLSYEELKSMADHMTCCAYQKGELLLAQGDVPQAFTVILKGSAKVYALAVDGREKILSVLSQDDYFGELYLFGNKQATYAIRALEPMKTCSFSRECFQGLLLAHPEMSVHLLQELGSRVIALEDILHNNAGGRTDARIAALLLEYSNKYAVMTAAGQEIILPLSREGMANYLGIARETMSRKLRQMEENGLIKAGGNKRIRILKKDRLASMAMGNDRA